jgi:hypothetical protein
MIKASPLLLLVLAACPTGKDNPKTLWLALDQNETHVKLIDHQPAPF